MIDDDDDFFVPQPAKKQHKIVKDIETQIDATVIPQQFMDENIIEAEATDVLINVPEYNQSNNSRDVSHPFFQMQALIDRLDRIITQSNFMMDDDVKGDKWANVQVNAIKETRMAIQNLMPKWEEMQERVISEREEWVDHLMDFTLDYISENLGEDMIEDFMLQWQKWHLESR